MTAQPFSALRQVHVLIESGHRRGKIVLSAEP